jgi:hypothetical protein
VIIQGNQTQSFISADQRDLGNGDSAISEFPKPGVRPEAYTVLQGGVAARSLIWKYAAAITVLISLESKL